MFVGAEFRPHRQMVADLERLLSREIELAHHVQHAGPAGVFGRRPPVKEEVVVLFCAARIRGHA